MEKVIMHVLSEVYRRQVPVSKCPAEVTIQDATAGKLAVNGPVLHLEASDSSLSTAPHTTISE